MGRWRGQLIKHAAAAIVLESESPDMEAQLKARQTDEQTTGLPRCRHGVAFWGLRGEKG